ncbi:hypothetical protein H5410_016922 [Solanum commersonii]|uniref:Uncharacterized protein n=1 Tax=Solanum commersonii TaxID=4109 RepID=A0A9J5ZYL8_SOLCO|nr:hypothetical protein H5410_016922 [Solanum commersonii]
MEQREISHVAFSDWSQTIISNQIFRTQNPVPFYGNQIFGEIVGNRGLIGLEEAQQNWVDMWAEDGADEEEENRWIN